VAETNGHNLNKSEVSKIKEIVDTVANNSKHSENLNPLHMFRGKLLGKTLIMFTCWITVSFGFYALTINTTEVKIALGRIVWCLVSSLHLWLIS
jgi:hypothetical protein